MSVSILVLTLNEEKNLSQCLESLNRFNDIFVLDSGSSDNTCEIASEYGANIITRKLDNWASHQNWALKNIPFRNEWIFYIDADERMTDDLSEEIFKAVQSKKFCAYYVGRKNMFMDKWLKYSMPPGNIMRLFKRDKITFTRLVNPVPHVNGDSGRLKNYLIHYNFSKGVEEWINKHNWYSTLEAEESINNQNSHIQSNDFLSLLSGEVKRRIALKKISMKMPFRGVIKFIYLYIIKRGILDGYAGLVYCRLQSIYEVMIEIKQIEIKFNKANYK